MARIESVTLVDDLDGGQADETVKFAVDGKPRAIDLSTANAKLFREQFAPYVEKSRPDYSDGPKRRSSSGSSGRSTTAAERARNKAIRTWGREQYGADQVAERGRVPADLLEAHANANYPATSGRADGEPTARYAEQGDATG